MSCPRLLAWGFSPCLRLNLPTQSRLLDLASHPALLHQLVTRHRAPTTTLIIANLAKACAERIGANPLLACAGGYYHDIGKLKRPLYFKENQIGIGNVHDESSPAMSAIITAHIRTVLRWPSSTACRRNCRILSPSTTATPVQYFYAKAQESGEEVNPEDYRYAGKPPESKEAAIVGALRHRRGAIRT